MPFGPQAQEKFVDSRKKYFILSIIRWLIIYLSSCDSSFTCHPVTHHLLVIRWLIIYSLSGDSSFTCHPMTRHLLIIRWLIISSSSGDSSFTRRLVTRHLLGDSSSQGKRLQHVLIFTEDEWNKHKRANIHDGISIWKYFFKITQQYFNTVHSA